MKKKFFRPCFALLLSMVLLFGGVRWDAAAIGDVSPFALVTPVVVDISYPSDIMSIGETQQLTCACAPSGGTLSWISSSPSVATVSSSGYVYAISSGTTTITARYTYGGDVYTDYVLLRVLDNNIPAGIKPATEYYIMNISSNQFLGLESEADAEYTETTIVPKWESDTIKWQVDLQSDGTFQFINVNSSTNKCLQVHGSLLYICTDSNTSSQKFTIERATEEGYEGLYLIMYDGNKYVAQGYADMVQLSYSITEDCYWSFMAVEKRRAEMFTVDYTYVENGETRTSDTTEKASYFRTVMDDLGYSNYVYVNPDSYWGYYGLRNNDIFIYNAHGGEGMLEFRTTDDFILGRILAHTSMGYGNTNCPYYVSNLQYNELALSRCILYIGCNTGKSYTYYNLVDETYNKGAHFVLGVKETLTVDQANSFLSAFLRMLEQGASIQTCIDEGRRAVSEIEFYYRGDTHQYLN